MKHISLLILFILILFSGCSENKIKGFFYDKSNNEIYEFNKKELLIYNLTDSIKNSYPFNLVNDKIEIRVNDKIVRLSYSIEKDSLWMFDDQQSFLTRNQMGLSKIRLKNIKHNNDILYKDYWYLKKNDTVDLYFKFSKNGKMKTIYKFVKDIDGNEIMINYNRFKSNLFFDKFKIFRFSLYNDDNLDALILDEKKDSLKLLNLMTNFPVGLNRYKSYKNSTLFGSWVSVNPNNIDLIVSTEQPWYFGDTIIFTKKMVMKRKIINTNKRYRYFDDILDKKFEIGLDTKFLTYKNLNYIFEINKLTKDTLIINNSTLASKMKYVRVVSQKDI